MRTHKVKKKKDAPTERPAGKAAEQGRRIYGSVAKAVAAPTLRSIACRVCGARIEFTSGLDEVEEHWRDEHPEALERLRRRLGHPQEASS